MKKAIFFIRVFVIEFNCHTLVLNSLFTSRYTTFTEHLCFIKNCFTSYISTTLIIRDCQIAQRIRDGSLVAEI